MTREFQQRVLVCLFNVAQPLDGHAVTKKFGIRRCREQRRFREFLRQRQFGLHINWDNDFLYRHANAQHPSWDASPVCGVQPSVGFVVVIDVTQQK
jgi:hypothetical protein